MSSPNSSPDENGFVGRRTEINTFLRLRSLREQKNSLYIQASGGLGKTKLVKTFITESKQQPRPWHVAPNEDIEPLIDFYDLANRSVAGLRRSIIARIGEEHFQEFQKRDAELALMENSAIAVSDTLLDSGASSAQITAAPVPSAIAALRLEVERLFFREFKRALREAQTYTALFFDTFEVVRHQQVGRWFLEKFLTNPSTTGTLIVFAGRSSLVEADLPLNVFRSDLAPFDDKEITEYFKKKEGKPDGRVEAAIAQTSGGNPLLIDLLTLYFNEWNGKYEDIVNKTSREVRELLVQQFLDVVEPEYLVMQDMAYLKYRYNREIFERRRQEYVGSDDFDKIAKKLIEYPFVKHRPQDDIFTLHDVFQEMVAESGRGDWQENVRDVCYNDIVLGWYDEAIAKAQDELTRDVLRAEQIAYILDQDQTTGVSRYKATFADIRARRAYDFNDLLWGTVSANVKDGQLLYDLTREQANWLFENSHYAEAAPLFEETT